jgi:hypothetical protein
LQIPIKIPLFHILERGGKRGIIKGDLFFVSIFIILPSKSSGIPENAGEDYGLRSGGREKVLLYLEFYLNFFTRYPLIL